jgi:hypothetical protein
MELSQQLLVHPRWRRCHIRWLSRGGGGEAGECAPPPRFGLLRTVKNRDRGGGGSRGREGRKGSPSRERGVKNLWAPPPPRSHPVPQPPLVPLVDSGVRGWVGGFGFGGGVSGWWVVVPPPPRAPPPTVGGGQPCPPLPGGQFISLLEFYIPPPVRPVPPPPPPRKPEKKFMFLFGLRNVFYSLTRIILRFIIHKDP